ncbi:hypothetical protein HDU78_005885 [Chytriomyces hyalinus]|nr:hypothetical protein HDU78_005885 [Chytriomyces hyalinus]
MTSAKMERKQQAMSNVNSKLPVYPETPYRVIACFNLLKERALNWRCAVIDSVPATREQIRLVHTETLVANLESTESSTEGQLAKLNQEKALEELFYDSETYKTAKMACGAVIASCRSVLNGEHQNAFALVRPPGHHAEPDKSTGYCHINNVAIAAQVMFEEERASRILIVDWDVHHGNGTQKHFLSNPNCLYFSIHAYHEAQFYPFSTNADLGVSGNGFNINVPWGWKGGGGDSDYIHVFNELLLPVAKEFNPDLVLVSAGFDAALGDVGERGLSPAGYAHMTRLLMDLAGGKVVLSLEGGVNCDVLARCVCACVSSLLGDSLPSISSHPPLSDDCVLVVQQVKQVHRQFWKCFEGCEQPAAAQEHGFDDTGEGTVLFCEATPEPSSQIDRKDIENSSYSLSDAVRFYHRCMWITQFALKSAKISMGSDMLEVLYTPVDIENVGENELSNTLYLLLLDGAYSRIDEKITAALKSTTSDPLNYVHSLALLSYAVDPRAFVVEHGRRKLSVDSGRPSHLFMWWAGPDNVRRIQKDVDVRDQGGNCVFDVHASSLAELMIFKFLDILVFMASAD